MKPGMLIDTGQPCMHWAFLQLRQRVATASASSFVKAGTLECLIEINCVTVEFGTVDTGELDLTADKESAGAAHSRAVDHYRVH